MVAMPGVQYSWTRAKRDGPAIKKPTVLESIYMYDRTRPGVEEDKMEGRLPLPIRALYSVQRVALDELC